jgi:hypothetical protein
MRGSAVSLAKESCKIHTIPVINLMPQKSNKSEQPGRQAVEMFLQMIGSALGLVVFGIHSTLTVNSLHVKKRFGNGTCQSDSVPHLDGVNRYIWAHLGSLGQFTPLNYVPMKAP